MKHTNDHTSSLYDNLLLQYAQHQLFLKKIGFQSLQLITQENDDSLQLSQKEMVHIQMKRDVQALLEIHFPHLKPTIFHYLNEIDEDPSPTLADVDAEFDFEKLLLKLTLLLEFVQEVISPHLSLGDFPEAHLAILEKHYQLEKQLNE